MKSYLVANNFYEGAEDVFAFMMKSSKRGQAKKEGFGPLSSVL